MTVDGRNFTSNTSKLLKHLDLLSAIQEKDMDGIRPVMVHLSLTNRCNLECDYCCYGGRDLGEQLTKEQAFSVIDQFTSLGTKGIEFTGGGEPTLHPDVNEIVRYAKDKGASLGLISNGLTAKFKEWSLLDWTRLSGHIFYGEHSKQYELFAKTVESAREGGVDVGSVFIYHGDKKSMERAVDFFESHQLPARITPDLTKPKDWIEREMPIVAQYLQDRDAQFSFVSDFNVLTHREHKNCYMRLVKPYVHPDGNVYDCPGASFSPENIRTVGVKFKVCSIDDIVSTYRNPDILTLKTQDCQFCKYQTQNNLVNDVVRETKDNDFA